VTDIDAAHERIEVRVNGVTDWHSWSVVGGTMSPGAVVSEEAIYAHD